MVDRSPFHFQAQNPDIAAELPPASSMEGAGMAFLADLERLKHSVQETRFRFPVSAEFASSLPPLLTTPGNNKAYAQEDVTHFGQNYGQGNAHHNAEETELVSRVDRMAHHLSHQWTAHQQALANTQRVFERLLVDLPLVEGSLKQAFKHIEPKSISGSSAALPYPLRHHIDPDRSVGIFHLLWNTLSFTTRGNTKPLAIYRHRQEPIFTGRIIALAGDWQEITRDSLSQDFEQLMKYELASLFVPADPERPAVMTIPHLGDEEYQVSQTAAPRQFLLKTVEMLCAGGHFHERELYN